jgi:hypothetical protein
MSQRERFIFGYKYWKVDCGLYVAFLQGEGADVHWHLLWRLPDSVKDWDLARLRFKEDLDPDILERAVQLTGESKPAPRRLRDQNVGECYWGNQEFNERGRWKVVHRVWEPEAFEQRANRWVPHGSVLVEDLRQNDELYSVCAYVLKEYDVDRPDRLVLSSDFRKKGASNPSGNPSH